MQYEWDNEKRLINLSKHGVDFDDIAQFEWESALIASELRSSERRLVALGHLAGRLHVVVYVRRGAYRHTMDRRKANRREERRYAQAQ